jgi:NAD+ synthase (glutamine-hydrolysing)
MMAQQPDLILNISASPFDYDQPRERMHVIRANVRRYGLPMFYVNQVGAMTEVLFDGGSVVMSPDAMVFDEMPYFEEAVRVYDLEEVMAGGVEKRQSSDKIALIEQGIIVGLRDYFGKLGLKQVIIGLSGGIDSALTAALATKALGAENVRGILMPSEYSSDHSVADAVALAENLGIRYDIIPIQPPFDTFLVTLAPLFEGRDFDVTEENLQARIRGILLMALSNKNGYILLNTTNKSEMAVGYGTLYGDLCGGLSVLGDVYKTEVYELAALINRSGKLIPENSIKKAPSAELRPDQQDSDSLPEYAVLDPILHHYIEERLGPDEIIAKGYDPTLVARILRMVNMNEFKRHQTAPVIRVSPKAFGIGRRMPIVAKYLS